MSLANSSGLPFVVMLIGGFGLWIRSTQTVKANAQSLIEGAEANCIATGARKLGIEATSIEQTFLLRGEGDRRYPLIPFATQHKLTVFYITQAFIGIYTGTTFDLKEVDTRLGSTTKEVYYPHVSGVEFSPPLFKLETAAGNMIYPIADDPQIGERALNAIRAKLRKANAVA
jgi:hypothetical protein